MSMIRIMHKTITPSVDSPALRHASGELLSLALMDARNHTLHLFGQYQDALEDVNFEVPQLGSLNPPLWTLGHVAWFQEWWIGRNMQRALGTRCEPVRTRLSSLEPNADRWWDAGAVPHASRWTLDLPEVARCRAYLLVTLVYLACSLLLMGFGAWLARRGRIAAAR